MKGSKWRRAEYRRDLLIVLGLFALGLILNVTLGLLILWLLQLLGWWDLPLTVDLNLGHAELAGEPAD